MKEIKELFPVLEGKPGAKIVITTHHKPDADALGSSLALWSFLSKLGFKTTFISPTDYGDFLKWMPGEEQIVNFEDNKPLAAGIVKEADFVFCLDFNSLNRINELGPIVEKSPAVKVLVDHHQEPEDFAEYGLWTTKTSSTCELIYDMIRMWKGDTAIDKAIASCIYAGMMTDTGSFRFDSVTPNTHLVAADLISKGVENALIHNLIYDSYSLNRMRFVGHVLANKLEVIPELNVAIISITKQELEKYKVRTGDTEGLVNFGLSIRGMELAALFVDRTVLVKISFRGKGKFPANRIAKDHFDGGGHYSAAGGQSKETLEQTVERFKKVIKEYKEYLT